MYICIKWKNINKMEALILKKHLYKIADKVTENTTIEDIFEQFQMLIDIIESEKQIKDNLVFSHEKIRQLASTWLK